MRSEPKDKIPSPNRTAAAALAPPASLGDLSREAALGSFGLAAFAVLRWRLLPEAPLWVSLPAATALWLAVAVFAWKLRQWLRRTGSSRRPGAVPMG